MKWSLLGAIGVLACAGERAAPRSDSVAAAAGPVFRNVSSTTAYVGDDACTSCHVAQAAAYNSTNMSRSFHRWIASQRVETTLDSGLVNRPTGYRYAVVEDSGRLFQVEFIPGPDGRRLHELRRRMDYVMGSGNVARTYFTESNGRLFQLPLTWYRDHGWDFSPGYEVSNPRFDRLMPDRCIACHSNFPKPTPHLEGKHEAWVEGIGCERCHGPGALHVAERRAATRADTGIDRSIVNPARLSVARRVDICEECHVHTAVSVLREGKDAFSYRPSQPLDAQYAYFKVAGSIDVVSHADRLRQSACFLGSQSAAQPMECATCHNPHRRATDTNAPCRACHTADQLSQQLATAPARAEHGPKAECVRCHMPRIAERTVPHGAFTEHWIRVPSRPAAPPVRAVDRDALVDAYFGRDRDGTEAKLYQAMGGVVYATLAADPRALGQEAASLEKSLGNDRTRRDAHFLLGAAWEQVGRSKDARRALQVAVQLDSTRPEALRALAQATARSGGTPAEIEPLFRRALDMQPALAWIRAEYADWLQSVGRADDAVREYRAAVAEQPTLATAWFNLGTTLTHLADRAGASAAFQEAVHLDPSFAEALAPLLEVSVIGSKVTSIRSLGSPLASLPLRARAARALAVRVEGPASLVFDNVPARGFVLIFRPDGSLLSALPTGAAGMLRWDLMVAPGQPLGAGLYRAQVQGRDASGNIVPLQVHHLGFVRAPM
ncbi:MAG: hypothetical protein H7066_03275 [Cytophagaceae bacterium]|nr:hypothetical protein [Gemmatimonadaceae bacterium]